MRSSHPMAVNKLKNKAAMPPEQQRYLGIATMLWTLYGNPVKARTVS